MAGCVARGGGGAGANGGMVGTRLAGFHTCCLGLGRACACAWCGHSIHPSSFVSGALVRAPEDALREYESCLPNARHSAFVRCTLAGVSTGDVRTHPSSSSSQPVVDGAIEDREESDSASSSDVSGTACVKKSCSVPWDATLELDGELVGLGLGLGLNRAVWGVQELPDAARGMGASELFLGGGLLVGAVP